MIRASYQLAGSIFLPFLFLLSTTWAMAQQEPVAANGKGLADLVIATSTVCDMCQKTIEENLIYEKGLSLYLFSNTLDDSNKTTGTKKKIICRHKVHPYLMSTLNS